MNVVLIGMPGAGKSTVGVLLAKSLGKAFADTDLLLQTRAGKRLMEILTESGADEFEKLENDTLLSIGDDETVIATGGSAVFCERGMAHLKENGICVYLDVSLPALEKRLTDIKTRGVVMKEGETLAQLLEERKPYYEKYADVTVKGKSNPEETVTAIVNALDKRADN